MAEASAAQAQTQTALAAHGAAQPMLPFERTVVNDYYCTKGASKRTDRPREARRNPRVRVSAAMTTRGEGGHSAPWSPGRAPYQIWDRS